MSATSLSLHSTSTTRIAGSRGDIWEFTCPLCSYRARYTQDSSPGAPGLEILSIGDQSARHLSTPDGTALIAEDAADLPEEDVTAEENDFDGDQAWLPPNLRAQVEAILRRLDFGN